MNGDREGEVDTEPTSFWKSARSTLPAGIERALGEAHPDKDSPDYEGTGSDRDSETSMADEPGNSPDGASAAADGDSEGRYYGGGSYSGGGSYGGSSSYSGGEYYGGNSYSGGGYYGSNSYSTYSSGGAGDWGTGTRPGAQALMWLRMFRFLGLALALAVAWPGVIRLEADSQDVAGWLILLMAAVVGLMVSLSLGPFVAARADEKRREVEKRQADRARKAFREEEAQLPQEEKERIQEREEFLRREAESFRRSARQAASAYRIVQVSAAAGLALLIVALLVAVNTQQGSLQIAAASLGAVGSATAAYIGATSLAVWDRAVAQLNWHDAQPLVNRQLANARKVADQLPPGERKDAAFERILSAHLALAEDAFHSVAQRSAEAGRRGKKFPRGGEQVSPPGSA